MQKYSDYSRAHKFDALVHPFFFLFPSRLELTHSAGWEMTVIFTVLPNSISKKSDKKTPQFSTLQGVPYAVSRHHDIPGDIYMSGTGSFVSMLKKGGNGRLRNPRHWVISVYIRLVPIPHTILRAIGTLGSHPAVGFRSMWLLLSKHFPPYHFTNIKGGPKKSTTFEMNIPCWWLELWKWKNDQMKVYSILFQMIHGFMPMQAI